MRTYRYTLVSLYARMIALQISARDAPDVRSALRPLFSFLFSVIFMLFAGSWDALVLAHRFALLPSVVFTALSIAQGATSASLLAPNQVFASGQLPSNPTGLSLARSAFGPHGTTSSCFFRAPSASRHFPVFLRLDRLCAQNSSPPVSFLASFF